MRSATPKSRRHRWLIVCCMLLLVLAAAAASLLWPTAQLPLTISRETTYFLTPRRPDGGIDYLAVFKARLTEGLTPEDNAALPLLAAFGSLLTRRDSLAATLEAFGKKELPHDLVHFTPFAAFSVAPGKVWTPHEDGDWPLEPDPADTEAMETLTSTWFAGRHERISDWLDVNTTPLGAVREASKRARLWRPLIPKGEARLLPVVLAAHPRGMLRGATRALGCRAMRSLWRGERLESWADLRAALALAALAPQEGGGLAFALGHAMETDLVPAVAAFLGEERLTGEEARRIASDIEGLPQLRTARECALDERLSVLDHVQSLTLAAGKVDLTELGVPLWLTPRGLDPDVALRVVNRWFDDLDRALAAEGHAARRTAIAELLRRLEASVASVRSGAATLPGWIAMAARGPAERRRRMSELAATAAVSLLLPTLAQMHELETTRAARRSLWRLGAALAAHRAEKGSHPAALEALAPAYLLVVPVDPVSGKPFEYLPLDKGYRLAWPGLDGRADPPAAATPAGAAAAGDDCVLTAPRP